MELAIGLSYIAIPIALILIAIFAYSEYRVHSGQTRINLNLIRLWNAINHNSITMVVTIILLLLVAGLLRPEIAIEAKNALSIMFKSIIEPLIIFLILAIILTIAFKFILSIGPNHKKK